MTKDPWPGEGLRGVSSEVAYQRLFGCWVDDRLGTLAGTSRQGPGERQLPLGPMEMGRRGLIAGHCRQHSQQHLRQILRFPSSFPYLRVVHPGPRRGLGAGAAAVCPLALPPWLTGGAGSRGTCGLSVVAQLMERCLHVHVWPCWTRPASLARAMEGPCRGAGPLCWS